MSDYTETAFRDKLTKLTNQANSIQSLSSWMIQNHQHRENIVRVWLKEVRKETNPVRIVEFLYLANDVVQNVRKSPCPTFKDDFYNAIETAFRHASRNSGSNIDKALPKLDQAQQQEFVGEELVKNVKEVLISLQRLQSPPSTERDIRFQLANFPETVSCPAALDKVRGSEQARDILKKSEEAMPIIIDYCKRLGEEMLERRNLQQLLDNLVNNVRNWIEYHEKSLKEIKRIEDRLKSDSNEVERAYNSLPDLEAEAPDMSTTSLPTLENLFNF